MKNTTQTLKKRLLEFIRSPGYRPLKDHHLADELGLMTHERSMFRTILRELTNEGAIQRLKGNRWAAASESRDLLVGTLFVSPQGHGMVRIARQTGANAEIFIPPGGMGGALHGDTVEVEKSLPRGRPRVATEALPASRMRPDGRVIRVVERRKLVIVGVLMRSDAYWYVIPDHPRINQNVRVVGIDKSIGKKPPAGYKVVVRLETDQSGGMLTGEIVEVLGDPADSGVDVLSILREHEIATEFSHKTEKEARGHNPEPSDRDISGRLDLRDEMIVTIDPSDAKDHDDAVSLRRRPEGGWILGVHIADVSHFVTPGSAIDQDALQHGNSVYMVDRFIPMLPPYLTSEVCSLKAGRDRLAYSVFITYDDKGHEIQVEMSSTVIHPKILLDYEQVQKLIVDGESQSIPREYHDVLRDMHALATRLRKRRMAHGALDLTMPEVTCTLDASGRPVSLRRRTSVEAYHLIEEFMLAANVAVAERLFESKVPSIYRIHEEPSEDQWAQMAMDLQQLGIDEHPTDRHDVQRISRQFAKEPLGYPVSISILRNLKRAIYSAECSQHFGLAFDRYTHFTSPIRRYSDLLVHRILKSLDKKHGGIYSKKECDDMAAHCSRREREASEAEEESLIIKRIQFYELLLQKGEIGPWPALITGSTARGMLVEIVETLQRGFIPTHALPDPNLKFDRTSGYITGRKGRKIARIGDVVPVELMRVDTSRRSIELRWIDDAASGTRAPDASGKRKSKPRRHQRRR